MAGSGECNLFLFGTIGPAETFSAAPAGRTHAIAFREKPEAQLAWFRA